MVVEPEHKSSFWRIHPLVTTLVHPFQVPKEHMSFSKDEARNGGFGTSRIPGSHLDFNGKCHGTSFGNFRRVFFILLIHLLPLAGEQFSGFIVDKISYWGDFLLSISCVYYNILFHHFTLRLK